jgi:hypothetical protein
VKRLASPPIWRRLLVIVVRVIAVAGPASTSARSSSCTPSTRSLPQGIQHRGWNPSQVIEANLRGAAIACRRMTEPSR